MTSIDANIEAVASYRYSSFRYISFRSLIPAVDDNVDTSIMVVIDSVVVGCGPVDVDVVEVLATNVVMVVERPAKNTINKYSLTTLESPCLY